MLFPSITFLYFFLPVSLLLYAVMPEKGKNAVLFGTGILFYFWGEPLYAFLLLAMVLAGYAGGRSLAAFTKCGRKTACKILLGSLVAAVVFTLGFFKYGKIAAGLPLGISFSRIRTTPNSTPQRRKFTPAPCHIPLTAQTSSTLKHQRSTPTRFPPNGIYR